MSSQYPYYPATFIMRERDKMTHRFTDKWKFRSTRSNKWYIVEMEQFEHNLFAIKFYYKAVQLSEKRYSLMTNDNEPRTIVYSCLELMRRYYVSDSTVSFGFLAAQDIDKSREKGKGNRRFKFYKMVVNNYFGTRTFTHIQDVDNRLYLLLNRQQIENGNISLKDVVDNINKTYIEEFNFSWD